MIAWIQQLFGGSGANSEVSLTATPDHVELSSRHLVIGLKIDAHNQTDSPIPIKEIQMRIYLNGRKEQPLRLYPLERYARILSQRALQKTPMRPFTLPAHETYSEQIRFISQEVLDIPAGNYPADLTIKDTSDATYTSQTKLSLQSKIKYRRSEEWNEDIQRG